MNGNFLGIGADLCTNSSVQVDAAQPAGILIANGEFTAFCDSPQHTFCQGPGANRDPVHVRVAASNSGPVKFTDSSFWGPAAAVGRLAGQGTTSFIGCHFDSWDNHVSPDGKHYVHNGTAAIVADQGSLILTANEFTGHLKTPHHVQLGPDVKKAVVTSNIVAGTLSVEHGANSKIIVGNNADDSQ